MYNPQAFKSADSKEAFDLMDQNPFATLISVVEDKPLVSHLPLTPKRIGDRIDLIGHLARANPHWKSFSKAQVTAIFHGPHTYITPQWYAEKNNVPTWNYLTLHVTGKIELIEDYEGIVECLKELTAHVERHWPSGWDFLIPDDLTRDILPKSIVGFKITVDNINFKKKLSQNKTPADRAGGLARDQSGRARRAPDPPRTRRDPRLEGRGARQVRLFGRTRGCGPRRRPADGHRERGGQLPRQPGAARPRVRTAGRSDPLADDWLTTPRSASRNGRRQPVPAQAGATPAGGRVSRHAAHARERRARGHHPRRGGLRRGEARR